MKLKLITFDVTNTLMKIRGSVGEHYSAAANKYFGATGQLFDSVKTEKAFMNAYKEVGLMMPNFGYDDNISSEKWWHEVVHRVFFSQGLQDVGILRSLSNQLYTDFCMQSKYELFPEVQFVLNTLKTETNVKIGVISNFDERLELLLQQLDVKKYFDLVLCSRSVGFAKPDKRMFDTALILSDGIRPEEALHIGDNLKLDYLPAIDAGFNALLINRRKEKKSDLQTDDSIHTIDTLESILPCNIENLKHFEKASLVM